MNSIEKKQATIKRIFISVPFVIAVVLISTQCDKIAPCDMRFDFITLTLKYPDNLPVKLDSSKVFWMGKSRFLEQNIFTWNDFSERGWYVIVDDGMQKELRNKRETMRFTGYLNGEMVHQQDILVGANRCHVEYLGKEPLTQVVILD